MPIDLSMLTLAVLDGPGATDPGLRVAAAAGRGPEGPVAAFVAKVRDAPAQVADDDLAALHAAGLSDDAIFELTVSAALGAGLVRLRAGLNALKGGG